MCYRRLNWFRQIAWTWETRYVDETRWVSSLASRVWQDKRWYHSVCSNDYHNVQDLRDLLWISYNLHQNNIKRKTADKDIEEMAKGQKRSGRAISRKPKSHTYKKYIRKTNNHITKICQKTSKLIIIHMHNKTWFKYISKMLNSFATFYFCIQNIL